MLTHQAKTRPPGPIVAVAFAISLVASLFTASPSAQAQPQAPGGPIVLTQGASRDVITYLMAGGAEHSDSFTWPRSTQGTPKYLWLQDWKSTDQYLRWQVKAATTARFQVTSMLAATAGDRFRVFVDDRPALDFTVRVNSWRREVVGTITIPAGTHSVMVKRLANGTPAKVKAFELMPEAEVPAYQSRAAAFRKTGAHWRDQSWGVMFQMGQWSYPASGDKLPIDQAAAAFDVPKFVNLVKSMNADYVIWSVTWWSYEIWAPISSVDAIVGNGNRTSRRDVIGEIAAALQREGINFYLYYHTGQDTHVGYGKSDWWRAQGFPDTFAKYGTGDRSRFFNNWERVISEMGQRWGTNLDGWFFDDGLIYYPAPYERLGAAARVGNPNRTVSWNNWYTSVYTDFTDVSFGEVCRYDGAVPGRDGRYVGGAEQGLMGHCMFHVNQDWGVFAKGQKIRPPSRTVAKYTSEYRNRQARNVPFSANLMMYSDGSVDPATLAFLQGVGKAAAADRRCGWGCQRLDARSAKVAKGSWSLVGGGNKGDDNDDVLTSTSDGARLTQLVSGTGVRIVGPKGPSGANLQVAIDGKVLGTVSTKASKPSAQEVLWEVSGLPRGDHVVTLIKASAGTLALDYVEAMANTYTLNDSASRIKYRRGTWASATRNMGDYLGDVTYTRDDGAHATFNFDGTGVRVLAPRAYDYGDVAVYVDGQFHGLWSMRGPGYQAAQNMVEIRGLDPGRHVVRLTKLNGAYLVVDAVLVEYPQATQVNDRAPAIKKSGSWSSSTTTGAHLGDLSTTTANGASVTLTFTGTGVRVYGVESAAGATVQVRVDGKGKGRWSQRAATQRSQVPFFELSGLAPGKHTITLTKVSGGTFSLDLVETWSS